jgi:hypothetical protein
VSNGTLAIFAGETRDMARVLAAEHGLTIPNVEALDAAIAAQPLWAAPDDNEDGETPTE